MDKIIKKKKPKYPNTLIYSLKGLLLLLLLWNLNHHAPEGFFALTAKPKPSYKTSATPYIEEISYNHLLSTTSPAINHYLKWDAEEIQFIDPDFDNIDVLYYKTFTQKQFAKIWTADFAVFYKGRKLNPNKVNALFVDVDGTVATCEDEGAFTSCFYSNLRHFRNDFVLWLSVETEEQKTFFTRIKITETPDLQIVISEEKKRFWKKIINRDRHKSIDNLSVVKPVFKTHDYLFKWGNWERYAHGPRGGRRVKLGVKQFLEWTKHQPYLYQEGQFVPFTMSVNFWNKKTWGNNCYFRRKTENAPPIASNECFKDLVNQIKVGDGFTIFIWVEGEFVKQLAQNTLKSLPHFMVNDQYVQFSIPIEIVAENLDPQNTPLNLTTSTFGFQLNTAFGKKSIVRMDTQSPKNKSLLKHYSESASANIVNIKDFKTVRRVITKEDLYILPEEIGKTYTLPNKVFKIETFPEFYDFNIQAPLIKLRGLSTVLDKTTYKLADFQSSKEGFEILIGDEKVKLLQCQFTVVPKKGKAIQYITENFTRSDIRRRLRKIQPESSLYFDKILFERSNGEQMVFPLATALHLQ